MVEFVEVTKKHTKEAEEISVAIKGLVESALLAGKDGFQPVQDLSAIVMANFGKLQAAVLGASALGDELKSAQVEFIRTFSDMGVDILEIVQDEKKA